MSKKCPQMSKKRPQMSKNRLQMSTGKILKNKKNRRSKPKIGKNP
jgi:hypothetical protein